jgi:hypothetical protein
MHIQWSLFCAAAIFCTLPFEVQAQDGSSAKKGRAPIYSVTVVERTTKAVNYEYRSLPTRIDFRGTVLLPKARGEATVESKRGRTEIEAKIENLPAPTRFGREYLSYVLWAITPEGAPHNLGEVVANGADKARLHVTTDLQAFGLIVTAEPYAAIHQPSDVVVLENEVRPDTIGKIEEIQAKFELMPRGHYTLNIGMGTEISGGPKISMDRYEAQLELYEAQNAITIASTDAERYAPEMMQKARQMFNQAQRNWAGKVSPKLVVQDAREAAQTAEDARVVAERRRQGERAAAVAAEVATAQQAKVEARADADQAIAEARAARAEADAERAARERAEVDAAEARRQAARAEATSTPATQSSGQRPQ